MTRFHQLLLVIFLVALGWSAVRPHDYFTWILEVFPALIALGIILLSWKRFPLTPLLCTLACIHAMILFAGGHYTYSQVPLGFWMKDAFGLVRNDYDRIGHFAQGFVPAIAAREVFIRRDVIRSKGWLFTIVAAVCLAISALYELLEWRVSIASGSAGDAFLGTQGDVWDTQEDMATALAGAITALLTLGRIHDRQLRMLSQQHGPADHDNPSSPR